MLQARRHTRGAPAVAQLRPPPMGARVWRFAAGDAEGAAAAVLQGLRGPYGLENLVSPELCKSTINLRPACTAHRLID